MRSPRGVAEPWATFASHPQKWLLKTELVPRKAAPRSISRSWAGSRLSTLGEPSLS